MYVKVTNGAVDAYPYNVERLRSDNPNTSFPDVMPESLLQEYGLYPVVVEDVPSVDARSQYVEQASAPVLEGGVWKIKWSTLSKSASEIEAHDNRVAKENRAKRDQLLTKTDWTQMPDAPVDASFWTSYRQSLRDITSHAAWPLLGPVAWPQPPSSIDGEE